MTKWSHVKHHGCGRARLRQTGPVDRTPDRVTPGEETAPHRRAHTTARDLERYARLFADRTTVMRSSAMRDLMEITARPEVISLAGGLPDTSTFPPERFAAQMTRIAQESSAQALQYGPTEGFAETKECIREVMAAEGMEPDLDDVIVTTGGQQAIDLVAKTFVDPGDVVIAEAPTYPGAVPVFCSYQAETLQVGVDEEGMDVDELERLLERLSGVGAWSPSPGSASCWWLRTTRTGCCATRVSLSSRCTSSREATTSSTSARSRRSSRRESGSAGCARRLP